MFPDIVAWITHIMTALASPTSFDLCIVSYVTCPVSWLYGLNRSSGVNPLNRSLIPTNWQWRVVIANISTSITYASSFNYYDYPNELFTSVKSVSKFKCPPQHCRNPWQPTKQMFTDFRSACTAPHGDLTLLKNAYKKASLIDFT